MCALTAMEARFRMWFASQGGGIEPSVTLLRGLEGGDRGVFALSAINAGSELMRVPVGLSLHSYTLAAQPQAALAAPLKVLGAQHAELSSFLQVVLLLLHELSRGSSSPYLNWLRVMPDSLDCTLGWSDSDSVQLQGTAIEQAGDAAKQTFEQDVLPCMRMHPDLWPESYWLVHLSQLLAACNRDYNTFLRAAMLVQSRSFHVNKENWVTGSRAEGSDLYMLPAIDMLNHSTQPTARNVGLHLHGAGSQPSPAAPDMETCFVIEASRDVAEGEQLLLSYGDLSDAELLQIYGFVEDSGADDLVNPHNRALLPVCLLQQLFQADAATAEQATTRMQALQEHGVITGDHFSCTPACPLPPDLLTAGLALHLTEEDFEGYKQELEAAQEEGVGPLFLDDEVCKEDPELAQEVCMALLRVIDAALKRYPTTVQEDEAKLSGAQTLPQRLRSAVHVRLGEKRLLRSAKKRLIEISMQAAQSSRDGDAADGSGGDSGGELGATSEDNAISDSEGLETEATQAHLKKRRL